MMLPLLTQVVLFKYTEVCTCPYYGMQATLVPFALQSVSVMASDHGSLSLDSSLLNVCTNLAVT